MVYKQFLLLLLILINASWVRMEEDMYEILGVTRSATTQEIKKAYKQLVRIWHPDKNKDPDASNVFMKINEAYETLTDDNKRAMYDKHGYIPSEHDQQQHRDFGEFGAFFRSGSHGSFSFHFGEETVLSKYIINQRFYESRIFPDSNRKPYFLYVFGDMCFACMHYEPFVEKLTIELEEVGIGVGTVRINSANSFASSLRITEIPQILAVINRRLFYYQGPLSMQKLRDFIRNLFPKNTMQLLTNENIASFLQGWPDNRVRAVFASYKSKPPVRFMMPAFFYQYRICSGYVNIREITTSNILHQYRLDKDKDTLLIVAEETNSTVKVVAMQPLLKENVEEIMSTHKYLLLPRLSSQAYFQELCPIEKEPTVRKLCVVLFTKQISHHDPYRFLFRKYAKQAPSFEGRVRFVYIYEEIQQNFVNNFIKEKSLNIDENRLKIMIVWRQRQNQVHFEWIDPGWGDADHLNILTRHNLENRLQELIGRSDNLKFKTMISDLYNEHGERLMVRLFNQILDLFDQLLYYFSGFDNATVLSLWLSLLSVIMIGMLMKHFLNMEIEAAKNYHKRQNVYPNPGRTITRTPLIRRPRFNLN